MFDRLKNLFAHSPLASVGRMAKKVVAAETGANRLIEAKIDAEIRTKHLETQALLQAGDIDAVTERQASFAREMIVFVFVTPLLLTFSYVFGLAIYISVVLSPQAGMELFVSSFSRLIDTAASVPLVFQLAWVSVIVAASGARQLFVRLVKIMLNRQGDFSARQVPDRAQGGSGPAASRQVAFAPPTVVAGWEKREQLLEQGRTQQLVQDRPVAAATADSHRAAAETRPSGALSPHDLAADVALLRTRRSIHLVVVHCSDSDRPSSDNIATIRSWHVDGRGWQDIGYHFVITQDGTVHLGRSIDKIPAAQRGFNSGSIAICLTGSQAFSSAQMARLRLLLAACGEAHPDAEIVGHNDLNPNKTCPNFDVETLL
ncbi:MAG: N-acetylmuramoyl-L-alanine amidase [Alphaproteobacteria bacterium]|nr:N-acetylmuramoyl-L-alanine amidase [Alphaproteobacteria bacterium]